MIASKQSCHFTKKVKTEGSHGVKVVLDSGYLHQIMNAGIGNLDQLENLLPSVVRTVCSALGPKNLEATYQRCLAIELMEMGVHVEQEVELYLTYKGHAVGTRRADMILTMASGQKCILELKALSGNCTRDNVNQLKYYMSHFGISNGMLINFPHESGFPEVEDLFEELSLLGARPPNKGRARASDTTKKMLRDTQIIYLTPPGDSDKYGDEYCNDLLNDIVLPTILPTRRHPGVLLINASDEEEQVFGLTKAGAPCKRCQKLSDYCHQHDSQRK